MDSSPVERVSSPKTQRTNNGDNETRPSWSDLPRELLEKVSSGLGIIDLYSFRSVCKDWKLASETASAEIESSPYREPWFLLYGVETSKCLLQNNESGKQYKINIPELNNGEPTCIASKKGWLLLLEEENSIIYFFCPFSRARIDLPKLSHKLENVSDYTAAFSSPPTCQDCVVSFLCKKQTLDLELYLISRGDKEWSNHKYAWKFFSTIKFATYYNKEFHFFDDIGKLIKFSVKDLNWKTYSLIPPSRNYQDQGVYLPYGIRRNHFETKNMKKRLGLEGDDDPSISICGTVFADKKFDRIIFHESISATANSSQEEEDSPSRSLKGVWIHPRFFSLPRNQSW